MTKLYGLRQLLAGTMLLDLVLADRRVAVLVGAVLGAIGLKAALLAGGAVPFNSDEAIVALMARHITAGARPAFFYGQAYMGSLDAFLVAGGFSVFGERVEVIRLVQILLYAGTILTTAWLGKKARGSWRVGVIAAWLLAIPTVNVTLYTTVSLGGYGEMLLLGNLIVLTSLKLGELLERGEGNKGWGLWLAWGMLAGLGLWGFGLTLVYSIPAGVYLVWNTSLRRGSVQATRLSTRVGRARSGDLADRGVEGWNPSTGSGQGLEVWKTGRLEGWKRGRLEGSVGRPRRSREDGRLEGWKYVGVAVGLVIAGGLVGAGPWWLYAVQNGLGQLVGELRGGAIAGVEGLAWAQGVGQHMVNLLLLGSTVIFGLRPPWEVRWLALPLLPLALTFWMGVLVFAARRLKAGEPQRPEALLLVGVGVTLIAGFLLTPFGADPSGRYFLPLAVPLSLFAAELVVKLREQWGNWAYGLVGLVLAFNLIGNVQSALNYPPGITTQFDAVAQVDHRYDEALMAFLEAQGETRGYTNYWVAYPLAFKSEEQLIFVPRLPYHQDFRYTERDDRYAAYDEIVTQSERVAYITSNHPELNQRLRNSFSGLGASWQEEQIGDYVVFYRLSQAIRPDDIGLGSTN